MLELENIEEKIEVVNITKKFSNGSAELYNWVPDHNHNAKNKLQIIQIQSNNVTEGIYYHDQIKDIKYCYILNNKRLYIIGGNNAIQYHIFEAILEDIIEQFEIFYGQQLQRYEGGIVSEFKEFDIIISMIFKNISSKVTLVRTQCIACGEMVKIYIKHSLIQNPPKGYPVSVVYINNGHGLVVYVDKDFKVRGSEIVNITG